MKSFVGQRTWIVAAALAASLVLPIRATQLPFALLGPQAPILSDADQKIVVLYQPRIVETAARLPMSASLAALIRPVIQLAAERSQGGEVMVENRGALLALALYVNGNEAAFFLPEAAAWPKPGARRFLLSGREDLAKHFIVSAAIVAAAGVPAADALGLYKEMSDARDGSGFSFVDLAADRAGQAFGKAATGSIDSARRIQSRAESHWIDEDLMPVTAGLPENLAQAEFTRRYTGTQAPAYDALLKEIDRRVGTLGMYR